MFVGPASLGSQGTVCGGGRYDNLINQLGGGNTPGVGFGMGLERVLMLMEATGVKIPEEDPVALYVASMGEKAYTKAFGIVCALRNKGVKCDLDHMERGIKSQFKYSDKIGAKYVVTIGENELETGVVTVKKMSDGSTDEFLLNDFAENFINKYFA